MEDINQDNGSVVGELSSDYDLGGSVIPTPPFRFADYKITYAQNDVSKVSCTLHSALTCLSNLVGYNFTLEERQDLWNQALKLGAMPSFGWAGSSAIDLVRNYWNKNHDKKITTFRLDLKGDEAKAMLEAGYMLQVGFSGNSQWQNDKQDGVLDGKDFGVSTFGHFVSLYMENGAYRICDNYPTSKSNTYEVLHFDDIKKFYLGAYVFVVTDIYNMSNEFKKPATWAEKSMAKAMKIAPTFIWSDPELIIGGSPLENLMIRLKLFNRPKPKGTVTLQEWIVFLDRNNLLK